MWNYRKYKLHINICIPEVQSSCRALLVYYVLYTLGNWTTSGHYCAHLFDICCFSATTAELAVVIENIWSAKPKTYTICSADKACCSLLGSKVLQGLLLPYSCWVILWRELDPEGLLQGSSQARRTFRRWSLGLGVPWLPLPFVGISAFLSAIIFCSAAHTLITSPSISSELPERSLEPLEHLSFLRERELGSLPFPGSESQPGFSNLFEKLWNFIPRAHVIVNIPH